MSASGARHLVHLLIKQLGTLGDYPRGVQPVADAYRIPRTSFFPGGYGLWDPMGDLPALAERPIVVVGHNWGITSDHRKAFIEGIEFFDSWSESKKRSNSTWWHLLQILRGADVPPELCFFTNAYMGLKDDGGGNIGEFPSSPAFEQRCRKFLTFQLSTLRPSVVLALGIPAVRMLAALIPGLRAWNGPRGGAISIKAIYRNGNGVVHTAGADDTAPSLVAVALRHPCDLRNLSAGYIEEVQLVRRAVALACPG